MRTVSAVIGANYGDEGKGLVTDYLSREGTLVVRFNGGAQAAHTVVTPDGRRHVFQHFGSGTFREAATYLARPFLANPVAFRRELEELHSLGVLPTVYIDPDCRIVTPYDMMLNQATETARSHSRHGSCGHGINETVVRNECQDYAIRVGGCRNREPLRERLLQIRDEYIVRAAAFRGLPLAGMPQLFNDRLLDRFLEDCEFMLDSAEMSASVLHKWPGDVVFEGAQGLRLDEDHENFPHVTRSKTGLANVAVLMSGVRLPVRAHFVTRTYITRHGAGPLPYELPGPPYSKIVDKTNVPNPHQGTIRYGLFVVEDFVREVLAEREREKRIQLEPILVVTCADQVDAGVRFAEGGIERELPVERFCELLALRGRFDECLVSYGPTRDDVTALHPVERIEMVA
jgi:adenylosuccinate synthase